MYLFRADLSAVYFCLGQGTAKLKAAFGQIEAQRCVTPCNAFGQFEAQRCVTNANL